MNKNTACPVCFSNYTLNCLPKQLNECRHILCMTCVVCIWNSAHGTSKLCPICGTVVVEMTPEYVATNYEYIQTSPQELPTTSFHLVGHSWVIQFQRAMHISKARNIDISTDYITDNDPLPKVILFAKNGKYKFFPRIILFAGITSAWEHYTLPSSSSVSFVEPNQRFNSHYFLSKIKQLNDLLLSHNAATKLFVFLPPIINMNSFNQYRFTNRTSSNVNWESTISARPQLSATNVVAHIHYLMAEFMPENFASLPANVILLPGLNIFNNLPPDLLTLLKEFMLRKTNDLQLEFYLKHGMHPTDEFIAEFFRTFQSDLRPCRGGLVTCEQKSVAQKVTNPGFSIHLKDAAVSEFERAVNHLQVVRDTCYPSCTNEELLKISMDTIHNILAPKKLPKW